MENLTNILDTCPYTETYLEPCETSKMERFFENS